MSILTSTVINQAFSMCHSEVNLNLDYILRKLGKEKHLQIDHYGRSFPA